MKSLTDVFFLILVFGILQMLSRRSHGDSGKYRPRTRTKVHSCSLSPKLPNLRSNKKEKYEYGSETPWRSHMIGWLYFDGTFFAHNTVPRGSTVTYAGAEQSSTSRIEAREMHNYLLWHTPCRIDAKPRVPPCSMPTLSKYSAEQLENPT